MKSSQIFVIIFCLSLVLIAAGCTDSKTASSENAQATEQPTPTTQASTEKTTTQNASIPSGQNLTVHFLDVGQGDSILIEYGNKSMLIDAGESDKGEVVSSYLHNQGISTLDYVVATHPHSDHIGGMVDILNSFQVKHFIDSGYPHTSKTYENMLTTIDKKNIPFETPKRGSKINFASGVDVEVLNPGTTYYSDDFNQNSIVLKVTDGKVSFLLMGDAGLEAENDIMKADYNVDADILKVGHHGSRSASGASFISAVSPSISVIEVGAGNDYGHPHTEVLERLQRASKVYRTDYDGTVTLTTNGLTYSVITENTTVLNAKKLVIPVVNLSANVTSGRAPLPVLFTFASQNAEVTGWDLAKDKDIYQEGLFNSPNGTLVYVFQDRGTYTFSLVASNSNDTVLKQVTITVR